MKQFLNCSYGLIRSSKIDPMRSIDLNRFLSKSSDEFGLIDIYMNQDLVEEELKHFRDTIICGDTGSGFLSSYIKTQESTRISRYKAKKLLESSAAEDCCLMIQEKEGYILSGFIRKITKATSLDILRDHIENNRGQYVLADRNDSLEFVTRAFGEAIKYSSVDDIRRFCSANIYLVCETFLAGSNPVYWLYDDNDDDYNFQGCGALSYFETLCNSFGLSKTQSQRSY